jgi:sec-independent protein translocase protein TatA
LRLTVVSVRKGKTTLFPFRRAKNHEWAFATLSTVEEGKIMFGFGVTELVLILVIILVIFGAGKLPEIGAGMGKGIKNFKKATSGMDEIDVTPEEEKLEDSDEKNA